MNVSGPGGENHWGTGHGRRRRPSEAELDGVDALADPLNDPLPGQRSDRWSHPPAEASAPPPASPTVSTLGGARVGGPRPGGATEGHPGEEPPAASPWFQPANEARPATDSAQAEGSPWFQPRSSGPAAPDGEPSPTPYPPQDPGLPSTGATPYPPGPQDLGDPHLGERHYGAADFQTPATPGGPEGYGDSLGVPAPAPDPFAGAARGGTAPRRRVEGAPDDRSSGAVPAPRAGEGGEAPTGPTGTTTGATTTTAAMPVVPSDATPSTAAATAAAATPTSAATSATGGGRAAARAANSPSRRAGRGRGRRTAEPPETGGRGGRRRAGSTSDSGPAPRNPEPMDQTVALRQAEVRPPGRAERRRAGRRGRDPVPPPTRGTRLETRRAIRARREGPVAVISRGVGEAFITLGVLMLLFVAYQLWWTNVLAGREAKGQANRLAQEFSERSERKPGAFSPGEGFAIMYIPKLDVRVPIAEGISKQKVLDRGMVGHYDKDSGVKTAMPWDEKGNFAVAGHRNTHGEPFRYVNRLVSGDKIVVETASRYFTYEVHHRLASTPPSNIGVVAPVPRESGFRKAGRYLTLTTCTPEFTSKYRLIVWGKMVEERARSKGKPDALIS